VTTFYEIINAPLTLFLSPKEAKRGAYDLEINSDPISSEEWGFLFALDGIRRESN